MYYVIDDISDYTEVYILRTLTWKSSHIVVVKQLKNYFFLTFLVTRIVELRNLFDSTAHFVNRQSVAEILNYSRIYCSNSICIYMVFIFYCKYYFKHFCSKSSITVHHPF